MPQLITPQLVGDLPSNLSPGNILPEVKTPDIRLLSVWSVLASVLALGVLWRVVHTCFQLGVLARSPKLGRLKSSDGRSPRVLAGHLTSVANAVVCLAAYLPAAERRLAADAWSLGALFPVWSRPLAIGAPLLGTDTFYLSLAGYCLHSSLLAMERMASGNSTDNLVLLQRVLLLLLCASVCMVEFVPELALILLLLEVPSPFAALWQTVQDFQMQADPLYNAAGLSGVITTALFRIALFGFSLVCIVLHPDARQKIMCCGWRLSTLSLCACLLVTHGVHLTHLCRPMCRDRQETKEEAL